MRVATNFTLVTKFLIVRITYYIDLSVSMRPGERRRKRLKTPTQSPHYFTAALLHFCVEGVFKYAYCTLKHVYLLLCVFVKTFKYTF